MKKLIIASALAIFSLAGAAHAAGTGSLTASGAVKTTDCSWLSSDVSVSLSNGVVAAFDCETAATNVTMFIGTTSTLGTTKTRTMNCEVSSPGVCNDSSCSLDTTSGECSGNFEVTGNTLFSASSAGGTVASGQLGASCNPDLMAACGTAVLNEVTAKAAAAEAIASAQ